ncbi:RDD family protein [Actinoplanes sp. NPDC026619]|uniref:RDD family protein n=1 Tax=Actinoplanes sp. NPDC026619 TaxID=3155798 RepID=UPI0033CACC7F
MTYLQEPPNVRVTGRRIVATLIDSVLFGIFLSVVDVPGRPTGFDLTTLSAKGSLWLALLAVLYYTFLEGLTGRTLGKLLTGIRVVNAETGARPGLLSGFVRTLLRIIDGIAAYLVAMIIVVNSKDRRRLGDMAAKTLVIRA